MSGDQDEDKQFDPTQKKLDDARKKGEIAKSMDLLTASAYLGLTLVGMAMGAELLSDLSASLRYLLDQPDQISDRIFDRAPQVFFGGLLSNVAWSIALWFVVPMAMVLLCVLGQNAFVIAPSKLAPKASRISLLSGFKNKFGRSGLFEFVKSFSKLLIYGVILGVFLSKQSEAILATMYLSPSLVFVQLGEMLSILFMIVILVAAVLGLIDYSWQRAEHFRKNKMSRKEIMDEMKQSEGDPMMKNQRRQKGYEIAMNKMIKDVPDADVIIVNPTHFAVALKWDRLPGSAPICLAKGADEIAIKIREVATESAIPIHSDPPTARALFATVEIGQQIAQELYPPVAAAIRFAEHVRQKAKSGWSHGK